jgi:hypothetical protein
VGDAAEGHPPFLAVIICYHPAVVRAAFFFCFSLFALSETLEDAARAVSRSAAVHLAASERAHVTMRNLTPVRSAEAARVLATFERGLRRNARNTKVVEVTLTISDNIKGYLLVAEIFHGDERAVEMANVRKEPAAVPAPAGISIAKKLLWEQSEPILDVLAVADFLFVLDTAGVARYERREGSWDRVGILEAASSVRDPRGRLELEGDSLTVSLPGTTCHGPWKPTVSLRCDAGSWLTAARNTIESGAETDAWPAHFSFARINGVELLAEMDGRTHVYDASQKPVGVFEGWGSDFVATEGGCAANRVMATSESYGESTDSIALYDIINNGPARLSDPVEFSGPVTALWPEKNGALAVVRNVSTGRYEAYFIAVDCGH